MCNWMSSDDDFFVLRRFGKVGTRVLLFMQDQIVELEEGLQRQDDWCKNAPKEYADSGTFRGDRNLQRRQIMQDLSHMLERYRINTQLQVEASHMQETDQATERFLLVYSQLKSYPNASEFQVENVNNWLEGSGGAIEGEETKFLKENDDLIAVVGKPKAPFRRLIDRYKVLQRLNLFRDKRVSACYTPCTQTGAAS